MHVVENASNEPAMADSISDVLRIARLSTDAVYAQLCVGAEIVGWSGVDDQHQPVVEFATVAELHAPGAVVSLKGDLPSWAVCMQAVSLTGPHAEAAWLLVVSDNPKVFNDRSKAVLEIAGSLAEKALDRTVEEERLSDLGDQLRQSQRDLRRSSEQLEISNRELEQFAYVAAHELVAPLRAVSVYAQLLQQILDGNPVNEQNDETAAKVDSCIGEITHGVSLMSTQVQGLLELSSINSTASAAEPVDLVQVVGNALATLATELDEAGANVTIGDLPIVHGQLVPLQSVFANLFTNSLRYRDHERPLTISVDAATNATHSRITVRDNGRGVTEADVDRIFRLFERASTTTDGTGIGLALSRRIVESFGGSIGLETGVAAGSVFWIELANATA